MQRHAASSIAGSAQTWRRIEGHRVVLAHTVLITSADAESLTEQANRIEAVLGRNASYRPEAVTSIAALGVRDADTEAQRVLAEQSARVAAPKTVTRQLNQREVSG